MDNIRVAVIDDEEVFREGITRLLNQQPHINVVLKCGDFEEVIKKSHQTQPDIILISTNISETDLTAWVEKIAGSLPSVKLVLISRPDSQDTPAKMMKTGARGCLARNISREDLLKSIDLISSGRIVVSPSFAEQFLNIAKNPTMVGDNLTGPNCPGLSDRELEIAKLVTEGLTNNEISEKLFISNNTVKAHIKSIFHKLEVKSRQQLTKVAISNRWAAIDQETKGA